MNIEERVNKLEQNEAVISEKIEVSNHRINDLEEEVKENRELTIAVKEIATEMKHLREEQVKMSKEQVNMNERIKTIENMPLKEYEETKKQVRNILLAFILGMVLTFIATKFGLTNYL